MDLVPSTSGNKVLIVSSSNAAPGLIETYTNRGYDHVLVHTNDQALEQLQGHGTFDTVCFFGFEQSAERTLQYLKNPKKGIRAKAPAARRTPQYFSASRFP